MAHDAKPEAETDLDTLFAAARAEAPGAALRARVLADAAAVQAGAMTRPAPTRRRGGGWIGAAVAALGGWGAVSGVTAAGVVGLALGLWAPETIDSLAGGQIWTLSGGGTAVTPDLGLLAWEAGDV